jgi:hypothetical protein
MSVAPKLNAGWVKNQSCDGSTKHRTFTNGVGSIDRKEKASKTKTVGDCDSAIHIEGLENGNVVQGCEHILGAESLSGADSRHDFFRESTPFGDVFEGEPT